MQLLYKNFIRPILGSFSFLNTTCRFIPTCSEYTASAVKRYGRIKGLFIGAKRIFRCNPIFPGGYDPLK